MPVQPILTAPNPKLKVKAKKVADVASVQALIDDLLDTLYDTPDGIGLAATQIGSDQAVVVIDLSENRDDPLILVNPEVVSGANKAKGEEGCLSVPGYREEVERFTSVTVTAQDREGNPITIESDEFLAIVMQHEIDHLRGNLFIDYLSSLKKQVALKKVKKHIKSGS